MYDKYESPLSARYASDEMLRLFSQRRRIETWRQLWTELAAAEHAMGLPVTEEQVAALRAHISDIDFEAAAEQEKKVRHDVMAHVYAYGKAAPAAAGIIHLGATGSEASLLDLFEGDGEKVEELNRRIAAAFGFDRCFEVCGQTYPRKLDSRILNALSAIAQSCCRMANDIRLLQHDRQLQEPFEDSQIGSSAMPYKRNPMRSERLCSLARYLMADAANAPMTASTQWLERTLDDSANRRISMPEGFLCADAILRLAQNITAGLRVNEAIVDRSVREYLPFLATENLMMEAVKRGGDRQALHELIRRCSMEAAQKLQNGEPSDLISRLAATGEFGMSEAEMVELLSPENYIGRCKEQVEAFLEQNRSVWEAAPGGSAELDV